MLSRVLNNIEDLQGLIDSEVIENIHLEYKEKLFDWNKKEEFLKDVSAFANASGGSIIYGLKENDGAASKVVGVEIGESQDELKKKWGNLIDDTIKPAIKYDIDFIPIDRKSSSKDKYVVIFKVHESYQKPHQIRIKKNQLFYVRHDSRNVPMEMEEIKQSFLSSERLTQSFDKFRSDSVRKIYEGKLPYKTKKIADMNKFIIHLLPASSFYTNKHVSHETIKDTLWEDGKSVANSDILCDYKSVKSLENFSGVLNYRYNYFYTQFYRDGKIEFVDMHLFDCLFKFRDDSNSWTKRDSINLDSLDANHGFEDRTAANIMRFFEFFRMWNFEPPVLCYMSCIFPNGIKKSIEFINQYISSDLGGEFLLPGIIFDQFPENNPDLQKELKPLLEILFGALSD